MTSQDIVSELRAWGSNGYMIRAADEIERLRQQLCVANAEIGKLRDNNVELRDRNTRLLSQIQELEAREQ